MSVTATWLGPLATPVPIPILPGLLESIPALAGTPSLSLFSVLKPNPPLQVQTGV